jgi:hypothetical protein
VKGKRGVPNHNEESKKVQEALHQDLQAGAEANMKVIIEQLNNNSHYYKNMWSTALVYFAIKDVIADYFTPDNVVMRGKLAKAAKGAEMSDTSIEIPSTVNLCLLAEKLHAIMQRPLRLGRDVTQSDLDIIKRCAEIAVEIEED